MVSWIVSSGSMQTPTSSTGLILAISDRLRFGRAGAGWRRFGGWKADVLALFAALQMKGSVVGRAVAQGPKRFLDRRILDGLDQEGPQTHCREFLGHDR